MNYPSAPTLKYRTEKGRVHPGLFFIRELVYNAP
jgi:hypothetical protein